MNTSTNGDIRPGSVTTADLAKSANASVSGTDAADKPVMAVSTDGVVQMTSERALAALFTQKATSEFRSAWDDVQRGFVDDPKKAVSAADELVARVIKSLAETFSEQRATLEGEVSNKEQSSTETLRLAFRRYRSFFERLLSI
jgi:hypothetical protein